MEATQINVIIDVAKEMAAHDGITVREALLAMGNVQMEELLGIIKDLAGGRTDDPRIADLQRDMGNLCGQAGQTQEWLRNVRGGVNAHEGKIETLMDAVQKLITTQGEQAQVLVEIRQRLGLSD